MLPVRHVARRTHGPEAAPRHRHRLFRGTADRDRGAALIEGAIVAPVFFMLILGLMDGSWALFGNHVIDGGAAAGVRTVSALANDNDADLQALQSVKREVSALGAGRLVRVVIYRANGFGDPPTQSCRDGNSSAGATGTRAGACNAYDGTDLTTAGANDFGCETGDLDVAWCPSLRKTALRGANSPPDYVGVWIMVRHSPLTGVVIRADRTTTNHSVLRIEPRVR